MSLDVISATGALALLNTHGGPATLWSAPYGTAFPTDITDVLNLDSSLPGGQWGPKANSGWATLGLTTSGIQVSRGFGDVKREADQTYGDYDLRPTSWTGMVSTTLKETSPANIQVAWVGGGITTVAKVLSTVGATIAAGVSAVSGATAIASIVSGNNIVLGNGPTQEMVTVSANAGGALTLTAATRYAHASGELLLKPSNTQLTFGASRGIPPRLLAVIAPVNFEDPTAKGTFNGLRMWVFRRAKLDAGNRQIAFANANDWELPVSFNCLIDPSIADPEENVFKMWELGFS